MWNAEKEFLRGHKSSPPCFPGVRGGRRVEKLFCLSSKKGRWRREGMENTSSFSFSSPVFLRYMVARIKKMLGDGGWGTAVVGIYCLSPFLSFLGCTLSISRIADPFVHLFFAFIRGKIGAGK